MTPDEVLSFCRARGFDGQDVLAALAWLEGAVRKTADSAVAETTAVRLRRQADDADLDDVDPVLPERYLRKGRLGVGGMGVVLRVHDRLLDRIVAMKVLKAELFRGGGARERFYAEARATSRLQHPGIVPVHDYGELPDGRPWFTMREVRGRTLADVIAEVHEVGPTVVSSTGWTFRRLIDAFLRVCEAVAYAHTQGLLHRDLKPANVMVGPHGEVLVLDWGLSKVVGDTWTIAGASPDGEATRLGEVAGTPAYMAPEQARGETAQVDARTDVYALGAMLYAVLSGHAPYRGPSADAILAQLLQGPPPALRPLAEPTMSLEPGLAEVVPAGAIPALDAALPEELVAACRRAMSRSQADRFPDVPALRDTVAAWLDGAKRTDQGLAVLAEARRRRPAAEALRARSAALRQEAAAKLADVPVWADETQKIAGWALEDEAAALEHQAQVALLEEEQLLAAALTHAPGLPEAHVALAERYRAAHAAVERDGGDPTREELLLRAQLLALPPEHPDRQRHAAYLRGDGALSLTTDPPGAEALLYRYELRGRRLVPVFARALVTPIEALPLPSGSYLVVLRHPGRVEVPYPVSIGRGEHWDGVPPGGTAPLPVRLPLPEELGPDDVYVAPGWFWAGGDPAAMAPVPRGRLWCDAFVLRRFPVTNREYIAFLDDLVATQGLEAALRWVPRDRNGAHQLRGEPVYGHRPGGFFLQPDADGDLWEMEHAVSLVDWHGAVAYAAWLAAREGRPWQLPHELAWEKGARGVDGRFFPWGNHHDPSWACMRTSHAGRAAPPLVDSYPVDTSVYGVRGTAGGSREWCVDAFRAEGPPCPAGRVERGFEPDVIPRPFRGGSFFDVERYTRLATRISASATGRDCTISFRMMRWVDVGGPAC